MLDKWDYSCNQNLSYKKSFASTKLWNKIKLKLHINLYIMSCPFSAYTIISMYKKILSYSRATNISWMENNPDGKRALSSSLLCAIVTRSHLLPSFNILLPFFWKITCMPLLYRIGLRKPVKSSCLFVPEFWIQPSCSFVESV